MWFLIAVIALSQQGTPVETDSPVSFKITHVESSKPQIVRIFNLDEGMRVIVLPPVRIIAADSGPAPTAVEAEKSAPIRIFNLSTEGTREIAPSTSVRGN